MNKFLFALLPCALLAACHGGKTAALTQNPAPSAEAHASAVSSSALTQQTAKTEISTDTTSPETISAQSGANTKTECVGEANVPPAQKTVEAPIAAAQPSLPKAQPVQAPAPDKAVFKDEPLIDFTGRDLHPYAPLPPDPNAAQNAPWAGEQLKYGIYYSFIKAGTAYIRNRGLVSVNGRSAYLLQTTAFSASVIDAFFKVRDVNQSWLDAENFYSLGYGQSVREGGYKRDEWVTFDYERNEYHGQVRKKHEPRLFGAPLNIQVLDMLTALYYVRAQRLEIGQDVVLDIVNREKQYPLVVKVLKKEKIKTAAGKFDCIVVEPQIRGEGIFVSKGKSLKVWLTDDPYKMPVKMQTEVFIGSVYAELLDYQRQAPANIL